MQQLAFDMSVLEIDKTTHHQDLVQRFTEKINPLLTAGGYKPKPYAYFAKKLAGLLYAQREELWVECEKAKNFSAYFFYRLKQK